MSIIFKIWKSKLVLHWIWKIKICYWKKKIISFDQSPTLLIDSLNNESNGISIFSPSSFQITLIPCYLLPLSPRDNCKSDLLSRPSFRFCTSFSPSLLNRLPLSVNSLLFRLDSKSSADPSFRCSRMLTITILPPSFSLPSPSLPGIFHLWFESIFLKRFSSSVGRNDVSFLQGSDDRWEINRCSRVNMLLFISQRGNINCR